MFGPDRAVAGRRGRDLGDAAHADGVVVAPGQQRRAGRRAQRGRVEAGVLEAVGGQPLECRRSWRATERAVRAEAGIVDEDEQDVRRPLRRADGSIGGKDVSGSLASYVVTPAYGRAGIGRLTRLRSLLPIDDSPPRTLGDAAVGIKAFDSASNGRRSLASRRQAADPSAPGTEAPVQYPSETEGLLDRVPVQVPEHDDRRTRSSPEHSPGFRCPGGRSCQGRSSAPGRLMQRKPRWAMDVSTDCGCRAAGR